jgi:hypothetical protein
MTRQNNVRYRSFIPLRSTARCNPLVQHSNPTELKCDIKEFLQSFHWELQNNPSHYLGHWSNTWEAANSIVMIGNNCLQMAANATAWFVLQFNFWIHAKMRQMDQCAWGLCWKILIFHSNKWRTVNTVMTSPLILWLTEPYLLNIPYMQSLNEECINYCVTY